MKKPKVLFPYTEAGLGHIMPMNSIADEFERLYGDKVEIVRSQFFTETGDKRLKKYEQFLSEQVFKYNRHPAFGYFATFSMDFWGTKIGSWATLTFPVPGSMKSGIRHMEELAPDLVVSTHWATNYYASKIKSKPLTAMYCPDAQINPLFRYPCDLCLTSMPTGYERAMRKYKRRFNTQNLKQVPFLIRKEAFSVSSDKRALRRELGLDEDKFTVLAADGGYGVGMTGEMCEELLRRDLPINLIAVCGKNEKLFQKLSRAKAGVNTVFRPYALTDDILKLIACSDISCGKSGASLMAEPCFFGVPQLITHYANNIEEWIGRYYIETVGSALKEFKLNRAVDLIERLVSSPGELKPYSDAAATQRGNYGAEKCARYVYALLKTKFPELEE